MAGLRIAMLLTDGFGGHGGIALYNRDTLTALSDDPAIARIIALPRIAGPFTEAVPTKVDWREAAAGSLWRYAAQTARVAISDRPIDLVWCAHANLLPICGMLAKALGARLILAVYGTEAWIPFERRAAIRWLATVDRVVTISEYTAGRFREWSGYPSGRIDVVANAVDLAAYGDGPKDPALVERYDLAGREVIMIFGRMHPTERGKGFDELLEAMPMLRAKRPRVTVLFAGDGGDRPRLEARARELGVADIVRFTGRVADAEKAAHYRLADAYVMPSVQEGFGYVHLEAMACGTPAVASMRDGAREAVRDGALGALVDPGSPDDIVRQTCAALDRPRGVPAGLEHFAYPRFAAEIAESVARTFG